MTCLFYFFGCYIGLTYGWLHGLWFFGWLDFETLMYYVSETVVIIGILWMLTLIYVFGWMHRNKFIQGGVHACILI